MAKDPRIHRYGLMSSIRYVKRHPINIICAKVDNPPS